MPNKIYFLATIRSSFFHARIRFGAKWQSRSKRHRGEKENRGLGEEGKVKTKKKKKRKENPAKRMEGTSVKGSSKR